jgi:oligoendopeptidase F
MARQKLIKREEQVKAHTWAVEKMFANEEAWEDAYQSLEEDLDKLSPFEGRLGESGEVLLEALDLIYDLNRRVEHIYVYSSMRADEDTTNSHFQDLDSRAFNLYQKLDAKTAFYEPEILALGEESLRRFLEETPGLKAYERSLELLLRKKDHTLDRAGEELLAKSGSVLSGPAQTYNLLENADLKFQPVDHMGETIEITNSNFVSLQMENDRVLRENVYKHYYQAFKDHENTLASLFQTNVKAASFRREARHYKSNREMYLSNNQISEEIYDNLLDTVHDHMPVMHDYVKLRKEQLGVEDLHFYDVYTSIVEDFDKEYSFNEAKAMVLEALKPMGEEYLAIVEKAFDERWMDIYPNQGKRSGAYSSGSYDSYPYMLLNFNGSLDSVFTLAHEMGHSVHSYLTRQNQPYPTGSYKIFVAEVASTCNEALLTHYLLETTTDKKARMYVLNHAMEGFKSTLYRQTMFAEFENIAHRMDQEGKTLTAPVLNEIYKDLNKAYFGSEMEVDDYIALEWSRIPHFYTPFYVYQYATGFSAAQALSQKILNEGPKAVQNYLAFLKAGSSQDPIDLLKLAGVDMSSKEPIAQALEVFKETIQAFRDLAKED